MKHKIKATYSMMDELMASPSQPMPIEWRRHQLTRMYQGLDSIERGEDPNNDDWRCLSDAVNMTETLIEMGIVEDEQNLIHDAIEALAMAGKRKLAGNTMRLDGKGIQAVRALLSDYASLTEVLSARAMIHCYRKTEKRIQEILRGYKKAHDVEVVNL